MAKSKEAVLENCTIRREGGKIIIEIVDADMRLRKSSTGKSLLCATGRGPLLDSGIDFSFTAYSKEA